MNLHLKRKRVSIFPIELGRKDGPMGTNGPQRKLGGSTQLLAMIKCLLFGVREEEMTTFVIAFSSFLATLLAHKVSKKEREREREREREMQHLSK